MFRSKEDVRYYVWKTLEERGIARFPNWDHIPNFEGAEETWAKIISLDCWEAARRIFVSPDTPQRPLIRYALAEDKEVVMATPKLRNGFVIVRRYAPTIKGILKNSKPVYWKPPKVDLIIIGSVAVDLYGTRIGKGGGYGDREIAIFRKIKEDVPVVTNVHDLQVFEDLRYLREYHDQRVDIIVTPTKILISRE